MKTSIHKIFDKKLYSNKTVYPFQLGPQYHNYNMNSINYFDPDSLRDDLIKTRFEYNKLNQSYQELKFSYNKLNNENIENLKLIAELCHEDNENKSENNDENNEENDNKEEQNNNKINTDGIEVEKDNYRYKYNYNRGGYYNNRRGRGCWRGKKLPGLGDNNFLIKQNFNTYIEPEYYNDNKIKKKELDYEFITNFFVELIKKYIINYIKKNKISEKEISLPKETQYQLIMIIDKINDNKKILELYNIQNFGIE